MTSKTETLRSLIGISVQIPKYGKQILFYIDKVKYHNNSNKTVLNNYNKISILHSCQLYTLRINS